MKKTYKGEARKAIRTRVVALRHKGLTYKAIGEQLNISDNLASTLYKEYTHGSLSIMDRLKLWLTFKV